MADSIFARKVRIEREHREKQTELMREYEETVYRPALKALREECAAAGHHPNGRWHLMVSGRAYQHCGNCSTVLYEDDEMTSSQSEGKR